MRVSFLAGKKNLLSDGILRQGCEDSLLTTSAFCKGMGPPCTRFALFSHTHVETLWRDKERDLDKETVPV
jgi:hypothetical protein